jgi:hypothetical protein
MFQLTAGPRFEYREEERRRVENSPTFAQRFPQLTALVVDLAYYGPKGITKNSQIKFTPNLANAHSIFRIDCPNHGCIRGDFDLTDEITTAVAERRTRVTGEKACAGWMSKTTIDTIPCHNILRYNIRLTY